MHEMSDVSSSKTIKNIMWSIVCSINSFKEIRKGKEKFPTFQLCLPHKWYPQIVPIYAKKVSAT